MNQTMAKHIDACLALLKNDVTHQGLIHAIFRFHINKQYLVINRSEAFYLNLDGTTYLTLLTMIDLPIQGQ